MLRRLRRAAALVTHMPRPKLTNFEVLEDTWGVTSPATSLRDKEDFQVRPQGRENDQQVEERSSCGGHWIRLRRPTQLEETPEGCAEGSHLLRPSMVANQEIKLLTRKNVSNGRN